jgi:hypothetical protein
MMKATLRLKKPENHFCKHARTLFSIRIGILSLVNPASLRFLHDFCMGMREFSDHVYPTLKVTEPILWFSVFFVASTRTK